MALEQKQLDELWKTYAKTKGFDIREKLIVNYAPLVKYVAGRLSIYFGSNVEYDDLTSYGVFGLIDAIDKFDIKKGFKFETYASLRIRGAIIDSIRELDWVPRSLRQKSKQLETVFAQLENELGHSASDNEVAQKLGVSIDDYYKLVSDVSISSVMSLDEFLDQNYEASFETLTFKKGDHPEQYAEFNELQGILASEIHKLPEKEKMVISLYYYEELTLKEISAIMKVSESRISQLHTKAILRMRGKLGRQRELLSDSI